MSELPPIGRWFGHPPIPRDPPPIDPTRMPVNHPLLERSAGDLSGMLWGPCPLCEAWMVDVVWSQLAGRPLTYTQVVELVEQAMVEHFTEHTAAVLDQPPDE